MLIEATPRDAVAMRDLLPPDPSLDDGPPFITSALVGKTLDSPEGVIVTYSGQTEFPSVDAGPLMEFVVAVSASVTARLLADWLVGKFRGRTAAAANSEHIPQPYPQRLVFASMASCQASDHSAEQVPNREIRAPRKR